MVTMFSGCRDEETSADAQINGVSEGEYRMPDWKSAGAVSYSAQLGAMS
jgi:hypothetical protein